MQSDAFFFGGVILFFFVLWLATGGPTKPISFAGPYITPIESPDSVQVGYGDTGASSGSSQDVRSSLSDAQYKLQQLQAQATSIQSFGTPSPYRGQVTISHSGGASGSTPDTEYVTIQAAYDAKSDITISGWRLVSAATGNSATIPNGSQLLRTGDVNGASPVVLHPGDTAIISSGESPVGASFRENECVGYLTQHQTFVPSLSRNCPSPRDEFAKHYNRQCAAGRYLLQPGAESLPMQRAVRRGSAHLFLLLIHR